MNCLMEGNSRGGDDKPEMFRAQAHIYKHAFIYVNSMVLASAIQLNIPDVIHTHGKPITIPELVSALKLPPQKSDAVYRIMRLLTHNGFFDSRKLNEKEEEEEEEGYVLTASSRLLLKSEIPNLSPFARFTVDPVMVAPWHALGDWFSRNDECTPFETAHGVPKWEFCDTDSRYNNVFNEAMASDSQMMSLAVKDCGQVFEGLSTLVDVGGGTGIFAKLILEAFPRLKCTVFDLPHVVADNKPDCENLRFLGGNMFHSIPSADAILFKHVMHNWSDEKCVKILKKCREAITNKNDGVKGKVIIIDMVLGAEKDNEADITEMKLMFDVLMMVLLTGRERTEKEWERLFIESGFTHYKISPSFGLKSLIEVFP